MRAELNRRGRRSPTVEIANGFDQDVSSRISAVVYSCFTIQDHDERCYGGSLDIVHPGHVSLRYSIMYIRFFHNTHQNISQAIATNPDMHIILREPCTLMAKSIKSKSRFLLDSSFFFFFFPLSIELGVSD